MTDIEEPVQAELRKRIRRLLKVLHFDEREPGLWRPTKCIIEIGEDFLVDQLSPPCHTGD